MTTETATGTGAERIDEIVEQCRDLHEDVDLQAVRRWKEGRANPRAIGYLPVYIPSEIVHAVGALPVGIIGGGDRVEVIRGDAYFQSYICHLPRSTVELGVAGKLDVLDGMLFPAICDVIRNLSGVWQILFPDRLTRFVDFPQTFTAEVGGRFYRQQLVDLMEDISNLTGIPYAEERLRASIVVYNENRTLVQALHDLRVQAPERVPTYEAYLVQRAGHSLPVEEHNDLLSEYLKLAAERESTLQDNARVVVVGAFCEQPPLALIRSLELAGCYIVDEDLLLGNRLLSPEVDAVGDPLEALTQAYLQQSRPWSSLYDGSGRRGPELVERVRNSKADGVVFAAPSFCDPALLDRPVYQQVLEDAGIPYTSFQYAENTGQLGGIREQVGTFAESIRLWGEVEPQRQERSAK